MSETQTSQEVAESNQLKGGLNLDSVMNMAGGAVAAEQIAVAQAQEEAQIKADLAAKGVGVSSPAPAVTQPAQQPAQASQPQAAPQDYFGAEVAETEQKPTEPQPGKYVPVEEHIKLRKRAQTAEQRLAELEQTLTAGANAGQPAQEEIQIDDEEAVAGKTVKQLLAKTRADVLAEARDLMSQTLNQRDQELAEAAAAMQGKSRLAQSQAMARKNLADFDAVMQTAIKTGVIDLKEATAEVSAKKNPALELYFAAKQRLSLAGIQVNANTPVQHSAQQIPAQTQTQGIVAQDGGGPQGEIVTPDMVVSAPDLFKSTFGAPKKNTARAT